MQIHLIIVCFRFFYEQKKEKEEKKWKKETEKKEKNLCFFSPPYPQITKTNIFKKKKRKKKNISINIKGNINLFQYIFYFVLVINHLRTLTMWYILLVFFLWDFVSKKKTNKQIMLKKRKREIISLELKNYFSLF